MKEESKDQRLQRLLWETCAERDAALRELTLARSIITGLMGDITENGTFSQRNGAHAQARAFLKAGA